MAILQCCTRKRGGKGKDKTYRILTQFFRLNFSFLRFGLQCTLLHSFYVQNDQALSESPGSRQSTKPLLDGFFFPFLLFLMPSWQAQICSFLVQNGILSQHSTNFLFILKLIVCLLFTYFGWQFFRSVGTAWQPSTSRATSNNPQLKSMHQF